MAPPQRGHRGFRKGFGANEFRDSGPAPPPYAGSASCVTVAVNSFQIF